MIIPKFFADRLAEDTSRQGAIYSYIEEFEQWFRDSKYPFFPDYTTHGIDHLEKVLATSRSLIAAESGNGDKATAENCFSPADASALILATLFHDSAMHLTKASFFDVVRGSHSAHFNAAFDSEPWDETWKAFYFSARRWSESQRRAVFGADEQGYPLSDVRDPFAAWKNLAEADLRLIGEFIRTHHGRLAHEFALFGVPGDKKATIQARKEITPEFRDLVGVIARSHTMSIRRCVDYIESQFGNKRQVEGVHPAYLMALLRVADYLQIDASRSHEIVFRYKSISSPISVVEHRATQAVRTIVPLHEDPESLYADTRPQDVATFLRIRDWLKGIQEELDASWAVLGEVYGRYPPLNRLGLQYRRIRSNLDDIARFRSSISYVPDRIQFDIVRPDLLALLVGPLYGDEPSFGVRELIQNSVDAVREYDVFTTQHPEVASLPRREQQCDVFVQLTELDRKDGALLTVSDRGIGMSEEIVKNYFLRAGASFRSSEWWRREFEANNSARGKSASLVMRSGRFGVGALAAFLIGKEITCETRHVTAVEGLRFSARLDSDAIEVVRDHTIPVGTSIRIVVDADIYRQLLTTDSSAVRPRQWDWYCFDYPTVTRKLPRTVQARDNQYRFDSELSGGHWRMLPPSSHRPYDVYWTFDNAPRLTCNGLFVSDAATLSDVPPRHLSHPTKAEIIAYPRVAVIDPDACLPLRLQRDGLRTADYPFGGELVRDVFIDLIAWLFFHGPERQFPFDPSDYLLRPWLKFGAGDTMLVLAPEGYGLKLGSLLDNRAATHAVFARTPAKLIATSQTTTMIFTGEWEKNESAVAPIFILDGAGNRVVPTHEINVCGFDPDYDPQLGKRPIQKGEMVSWKDATWHVQSEERCGQILTTSKSYIPRIQYEWSGPIESRSFGAYLTEMTFPAGVNFRLHRWYLDKIWSEFFGTEWIPYDGATRIARFPQTAEQLRRYYTGSRSEKP